jgi:hypothetical protein
MGVVNRVLFVGKKKEREREGKKSPLSTHFMTSKQINFSN